MARSATMTGGLSLPLATMTLSLRMVSFSFSFPHFKRVIFLLIRTGFQNFGQDTFKDASGFNLDSQALVFKIKLPDHSRPFDRDQD